MPETTIVRPAWRSSARRRAPRSLQHRDVCPVPALWRRDDQAPGRWSSTARAAWRERRAQWRSCWSAVDATCQGAQAMRWRALRGGWVSSRRL